MPSILIFSGVPSVQVYLANSDEIVHKCIEHPKSPVSF